MDEISKRIELLVSKEGSAEKFSQLVSFSKGTVDNYQKNIRKPSYEALVEIARAGGVSIKWLLWGDGEPPQIKFIKSNNVDKTIHPNVPIRGTAAGAMSGSITIANNVIEWISRPKGLEGIPDAYSLYVTGSSMWPRYKEGELIFVHPHKPVVQGDIVIIQQQLRETEEPIAFIKEFMSQSDTMIKARQYTPDATIEYARKTIKSIHRVLTPNEIVGV